MPRCSSGRILTYLVLSLIAFPAVTCSHRARTSYPGTVDWSAVTIMRLDNFSSPFTLKELKSVTGLRIALPSYLPYGTARIMMMPGCSSCESAQPVANISLWAQASEEFSISLSEKERDPAQSVPDNMDDVEMATFGGVDVTCGTMVHEKNFVWPKDNPFPLPSPQPPARLLDCLWADDTMSYEARFDARDGVVTAEMRDEALRVVASMIEGPYTP